MTNIYDTAVELHNHGITVIPVRADHSKAPAIKAWQNFETTPWHLDNWFDSEPGWPATYTALGIVTGTRSGNLELTEIEGRAAHEIPGLKELADASGLGDLWDKLNAGWIELSPSGGIHWFYRVDGEPVPGNQKIAQAADRTTIAETRGEGGQVVAAPTGGHAHETGKPWTRLRGGPNTIPTITPEERRAFHQLLATLDVPRDTGTPGNTRDDLPPGLLGQEFLNDHPGSTFEGVTPGDDYEARTTWQQILEPAGWKIIFNRGKTTYWCRPGKTEGISATTGHADDRDRLYVFSSSTDFETFTPITKFHAYAVLNHGGDHSAAASELRKEGHGEPPKIKEYDPTPAAPTASSSPTPKEPQDKTHRPQGVPIYTDHGNALLLLHEHGKNLRYNHEKGRWLIWNGTRWEYQPDNHAGVRELAKATIVAMDTTDNATAKRHQAKSLSNAGISNMINMACTNPHILISSDQLDTHPHELNTPTGIVNLDTGELLPHDPAHLHTKQALVGPDPNMDTPGWHAFLTTTFQGNQPLIDYFQRLCGYAATGDASNGILPFFFGSGANGKTVALEVLMKILGDYAGAAPRGLLTTGPKAHETEVASLAGLRLAVAAEVNETDQFDEAKVKMLTGGDRITARYMFRDFFSFDPSHTLILMGNYQPKVASGGDSFWRRLRIIPFTYRVPDEHRVEGLEKILVQEEGPGILNWIIQGAIKALADGLQDPPEVRAATAQYSQEEDTLGRFLTETCQRGDPGHLRVDTRHIMDAYSKWCRENHEQELTPQMFGRRIRNQYGIGQTRANGQRYYTGIALQADPDEPAPGLWMDKDR